MPVSRNFDENGNFVGANLWLVTSSTPSPEAGKSDDSGTSQPFTFADAGVPPNSFPSSGFEPLHTFGGVFSGATSISAVNTNLDPNRGTGLEVVTVALAGGGAAVGVLGRVVTVGSGAAGPLVANAVEELEESPAGNTIAVGLSEGNLLKDFAARMGASTYGPLGWANQADAWKHSFLQAMNNPATRLVVNLTEVGSPWSAAQKAAMGQSGFTGNRVPWGSSTDWVLLQILQNPSWWSLITFWENGINVPNPFQYRRSQRLLEASFHFDRREQRCCGRARDKAQAVHREEIADQPAGLRVSHSTE